MDRAAVMLVEILPTTPQELLAGRLKTQVRKTKVPGDEICKYGKRKYESATVENVSTAT